MKFDIIKRPYGAAAILDPEVAAGAVNSELRWDSISRAIRAAVTGKREPSGAVLQSLDLDTRHPHDGVGGA